MGTKTKNARRIYERARGLEKLERNWTYVPFVMHLTKLFTKLDLNFVE